MMEMNHSLDTWGKLLCNSGAARNYKLSFFILSQLVE